MNPSELTTSAFRSHIDDERRRAEAARRAGGRSRGRARRARRRETEEVVIRAAGAPDGAALARLAHLDSSRVPAGDVIVAEVGGDLVAAVSVADGRAVADPFRRTADLVGLLRMRAEQLRAARHGTRSRGLTGLVRGRAGVAA